MPGLVSTHPEPATDPRMQPRTTSSKRRILLPPCRCGLFAAREIIPDPEEDPVDVHRHEGHREPQGIMGSLWTRPCNVRAVRCRDIRPRHAVPEPFDAWKQPGQGPSEFGE